jgi:hypothetical protein
LRNTEIQTDPNGKRCAIGQEWDVVVGLQDWKHFERNNKELKSDSNKVLYLLCASLALS